MSRLIVSAGPDWADAIGIGAFARPFVMPGFGAKSDEQN
jgi:hypothetical protein